MGLLREKGYKGVELKTLVASEINIVFIVQWHFVNFFLTFIRFVKQPNDYLVMNNCIHYDRYTLYNASFFDICRHGFRIDFNAFFFTWIMVDKTLCKQFLGITFFSFITKQHNAIVNFVSQKRRPSTQNTYDISTCFSTDRCNAMKTW